LYIYSSYVSNQRWPTDESPWLKKSKTTSRTQYDIIIPMVLVCVLLCVRRLSKRVRPERFKTARDKRASGSTGGVYFFSQNFISGRRRVGDGHGIEQQLDDPTTLPATSLQRRRRNCFPKRDNISIILLLLFCRPRFVFISKAVIARPGRWSAFGRKNVPENFSELFSFLHSSRYIHSHVITIWGMGARKSARRHREPTYYEIWAIRKDRFSNLTSVSFISNGSGRGNEYKILFKTLLWR